MSTIDRGNEVETSPMYDGQRLDRTTFHELYEQCSDDSRFELIGGLAYRVLNAGPEHGISDGSSGFWLDPEAMLACVNRRIRETIDRGIASPDHAAFVEKLAQAGGAGRG